jgi:hypothetical protein
VKRLLILLLLCAPLAKAQNTCASNLPCTVTGNWSFSGNNSHSGTETFKNINTIRYASLYAGSDWCTQANNADTDIGANPGEIWIDKGVASATCAATLTQSNPRVYRFIGGGTYTAPLGDLVFTQPTRFDGTSRSSTTLNFTGSSGIAIAFNWGTTGSYQQWGAGAFNIQLLGPGGPLGNGSSAGTGISIGTNTNSPIGVAIDNVLISGFATPATWVPNNATWGATFNNTSLINNTSGLAVNNVMESLVLNRNVIGRTDSYQTCAVNVTANVINMQMVNNEFDAGQFCMSAGTVTDTNGHYENVTFPTTNPFTVITGGTYHADGCQYVQTRNTSTLPPAFISNVGGKVTNTGCGFFNVSSTPMTNAVLLDTTAEYHQFGAVSMGGVTKPIGNTAGWTGSASYDNSGANSPPSFTLSASGTNIPFYQLCRGSSSQVCSGIRQDDNVVSNTTEFINNGTAFLQASGTFARFPTGTTLQPQGGISTPMANGTALQVFNTTTTCTTAASVGAICTTAAITLPVAEADTSYRAVCTGKGLTGVPVVIATTNSSATQFTITIAALTAVAASFASYDCTVGHN